MFGIAFFNKWLHLVSVIGIVGGLGFASMLLAQARSKPEASETIQAMWKRFGIRLRAMWIVALLTGFYNLALVSPSVNGEYQRLLGLKMGLAILMFLLTLFVARPSASPDRSLQAKSGWLLVLILLGVVLVGLSAHLNMSRINGSGLKVTSHV